MSESNDTDARKSETTVQRRDNWNDGEIRVLLDMWGDDKIQESLESSGRNIVVYRRIADRFNRALLYGEPGTDGLPERSAQSCRTKIKSLQQQYKKAKDNNQRSGRGRQTFRYYEIMDKVLGTRPTTAPLNLVDTGELHTEIEPTSDQDDSADEVNTSSSQNDRAATPVPGPTRAATPGTSDRPDTPRSAGTPGAVGTEQDTPTTGRTDHNQPARVTRKRKAVGRSDRMMEGFMTQFAAAQREAAVMFNSAEDKRLKVMMDMEERRQEREKATREEERIHEEKMMKMMFMMMNPGHQQMPVQHYQTPQMMNPSVVMPMHMSNITSSTPNSDINNAPNMTTLLNMPHSSANNYYHDQI